VLTFGRHDAEVAMRATAIPMPEGVAAALRCPACGRWLIRGDTSWTCWRGHGKLIGDCLLVERVEDAAAACGFDAASADAVVKEFRREQEQREAGR
jgi:hypothetical protein